MYPQRPPLPLIALLGTLIIVYASLTGCSSSDTSNSPTKPDQTAARSEDAESSQRDSPKAAYESAKAAMQAQNYPAFTDCLTPESQNYMAGAMITQSLFLKEIAARPFGGPEGKEDQQNLKASCKALDDLLANHGLTQDRLQAFQAVTTNPTTTPEEGMAAVVKLTASIKDKPAFLSKIMGIMDSISTAHAGEPGGAAEVEDDSLFVGTLEGVNVEGDRATASVVFGAAGEEQRAPIGFRKVNERWSIDLTAVVRKPK